MFSQPATVAVSPCMQNRAPLLVHLTAYAALLTIAACGALEPSATDGTATQSQTPTNVGATTTPSADGNTYAGPSNTNNIAGNTNVVMSPNTIQDGNTTNSNTTNGNTTNSNTTTPQLDCSKTWTNYAKAFFTNNCADCHSHNHSSLTNYTTVKNEGPTLQTYISARIMPVGATLSAGDYNNVLNWIACKMPE